MIGVERLQMILEIFGEAILGAMARRLFGEPARAPQAAPEFERSPVPCWRGVASEYGSILSDVR